MGESYHGAPFSGHLELVGAPALVLVDVSRAYTDPGSPLHLDAARSLEVMVALRDRCEESGHPVVWTRVEYQPGGADGGLFYRKVPSLACFDAGSPWGEYPDGFGPRPGDLEITKQYPSAFFGTGLGEMLRARSVEMVLICGYSTSGCVRATTLDALCEGFIPVVVADGCADRHATAQASNLNDLGAKYAEVVEVDRALALL